MKGLKKKLAGVCAITAFLSPAMRNVWAQEAHDPFKTEIFLTPYSKVGRQEITYPYISGQFLALGQYTNYFGVKDDKGQIPHSHWVSVQPTIDSALALQLTRKFSIRAKATLNSSTNETQDNAFTDLGVDLNNLFAAYTADHYALYAGKMDIGFGDAWHVVDGLYSGFTGDYEYEGAVGLGARYTFTTNGYGDHSVAAVVFKRDDSDLSRRLSVDDGLISDTTPPVYSDKLQSFVVAYDVRNLPGLEHISLGLDVGQLKAEPGHGETANTVSARLRYDTQLGNGWAFGWYNEATFSTGFQGTPVSNANGVTSLTLVRGNWQLVATAAVRKFTEDDGTLAQYGFAPGWGQGYSGAITYATPKGLIFQTGLTHQHDQGTRLNQGVFRIAYQTGF